MMGAYLQDYCSKGEPPKEKLLLTAKSSKGDGSVPQRDYCSKVREPPQEKRLAKSSKVRGAYPDYCSKVSKIW